MISSPESIKDRSFLYFEIICLFSSPKIAKLKALESEIPFFKSKEKNHKKIIILTINNEI